MAESRVHCLSNEFVKEIVSGWERSVQSEDPSAGSIVISCTDPESGVVMLLQIDRENDGFAYLSRNRFVTTFFYNRLELIGILTVLGVDWKAYVR